VSAGQVRLAAVASGRAEHGVASWPKEVGTGRSPVRASLVAAVGLLCVSTPASADGIRLDVCPMASEGQSCSNAIPGSRPDTPGPVSIPGTPPPATVPGTCVQGKCERYGLISAGGNGGGAGAGGASGGGGASGASGAGGATFGPILYDCLRCIETTGGAGIGGGGGVPPAGSGGAPPGATGGTAQDGASGGGGCSCNSALGVERSLAGLMVAIGLLALVRPGRRRRR